MCDVSATKVFLAFALCCLCNTDFESSHRLTAGLNAEWTQDAGHRKWTSAGRWRERTLEVHWTALDGASGRLDCNYSFGERDPTVKHTKSSGWRRNIQSFVTSPSPLPSLRPCPQKQLWRFNSEGLFTITNVWHENSDFNVQTVWTNQCGKIR